MASAYQPAGYPILVKNNMASVLETRARQLRGYANMYGSDNREAQEAREMASQLEEKSDILRGKRK